MNEPINKWSNQTLINWVNTLNEFSSSQKTDIINGINNFGPTGATGADVNDAETDDLADSFGISKMVANRLAIQIHIKKDQQFMKHVPSSSIISTSNNNNNNNNNNDTFSLTLHGQKGAYYRIDKLKSSYTIKYLKQEFMDHYGQDLNNEEKRKGITMYKMGVKLEHESYTLAQYQIYNDIVPITVLFRVSGGLAQQKYDDNKDEEVEYRVRKLNYKKYKQIVLSKDPDCIMGYNDGDGIKRARMPCGCSFASDTMYRYMKAAFDKDNNFRSVIMQCPMPTKQCKGTQQQRQWDWSLVFIIADLSDNEKSRYSQIITNRVAGIKNCPHCKSNCQRNKDLKIFRVHCNQCSNSDWCWECGKVWRGSGLTVCGNNNCTAQRLNEILGNAPPITPSWDSKIKIPSIRHCPECLTIIQYIEKCKHMTCVGCPYEFCFQCLTKWDGNYSCTTIAPKQVIK